MAVFKVALRKAIGAPFNRKWSNTYYVDAGDATEALTLGTNLWNLGEKLFTSEGVYCYEVYANSLADPPGSPGALVSIDPEDQRGALSPWNPANALPLFNVVRVDFAVFGSRPSRKFYRLGLQEGSIENGVLFPSYAADIAVVCNDIADFPYTVDVDGQSWYSATVKGLTSRRLGRESGVDVPVGPPFG